MTRNTSKSTPSLDILMDDSDSLSSKSVGKKGKKSGKNKADGQDMAVASTEKAQGLNAKRKKDIADTEDRPCSKCDGIIHDQIKASSVWILWGLGVPALHWYVRGCVWYHLR